MLRRNSNSKSPWSQSREMKREYTMRRIYEKGNRFSLHYNSACSCAIRNMSTAALPCTKVN